MLAAGGALGDRNKAMSHNLSHTVRLLSERGSQAARPGPARGALKLSVEGIVQFSLGNEEADTQLQSILRCAITARHATQC